MKIRGAVLDKIGVVPPYERNLPLSIETLELDPPQRDEVLVRIRAAGICHSDLSVINGSRPRPTPMLLGHEAAGVVVETGPGVDSVASEDHVVLVFVPSCGHCVPCAEGRPALCEPAAIANAAGTLLGGAKRLRRNGEYLNHHLGVSAFADHAVVNKNSVVKIDRAVGFAQAALFGCAVITGVGAVLNTAKVAAGSTVAVIGLGGIGLNAVLGAKLAGARQIVAIDLQNEKLKLAAKLGATDCFNADEADCPDEVRKATAGGVDVAFEFAGSTQALGLAWTITRRGGRTVSAGLPHPDRVLEISPAQMVAEERTLQGSYLGSCIPIRDIPKYLSLYRQGQLPVDELLSHTLQLADINGAFDRLASGEAVRQVVLFDD